MTVWQIVVGGWCVQGSTYLYVADQARCDWGYIGEEGSKMDGVRR
jgi:hypothetical protein